MNALRIRQICAGILCGCSVFLYGCFPVVQVSAPTIEPLPPETVVEVMQETIPETTVPETTVPTTTVPEPEEFILTFAGDCTLGTDHKTYGGSGTFVYIVGEDYAYPFSNVLSYFENDDFSIVNLEGTFTDYNVPQEKDYKFRAPPAYAKILTMGSVEAVNLSNNHSYDYGQTGYTDTKATLEAEGISYVEDLKTMLYTTQRGLKVGVFSGKYEVKTSKIQEGIAKLRGEGAEIVIASFHWGVEGSYRPTRQQKNTAYAAIDAGADIVFGHHPHVLQPIEEYNDGVIFYSLGNFSFGGNRNPRDKDSAILQQTVIRESDGTVHLGTLERIPVRISSVSSRNDYKPTPYEIGTEEYLRVLSKLDGSFEGSDLVVSTNTPATTQPAATEPATTQPSATQPVATEPPATQPASTELAATQPAPTQAATPTEAPTPQPPQAPSAETTPAA